MTPENPINVQKEIIEESKKNSNSSNFTSMPSGNYIWHENTVNTDIPGSPLKGKFEKIEGKPCVPGNGMICM